MMNPADRWHKNRKYSVVPYDSAWAKLFEQEAARFRKLLGDTALSIEHIGSSAVPGLAGKPTIDIMIVVHSLADIEQFVPEIALWGYTVVQNYVWENSMLCYKERDNARTFNVHVVPEGHSAIVRNRAVRDYFLKNPERAKEYSDLKMKLYSMYPDDYRKYRELKTDFLNNLEADALKNETP